MPNEVPVSLLKPHPRNAELFPEKLPDELWRQMVEDVRENGILNPLIVAPDYTVLAGHLRLEAAKEAGLARVPVIIRDLDPESEEAVSLLIRDNLLRRQLSDVQVARLIRKLKELRGVKRGGDRRSEEARSNCQFGSLIEIANVVGLPERTVYRLDKLNDLIPDLQALLESGRWTATTVAAIVGSLPPEEQRELLASLGESGVCGLSVKEAQELKRELDIARKEKEALNSRLIELEEEKQSLSSQLADIQDSLSSVEEEIAEKLGRQYEEKLREALSDLQRKLREKQEEAEELRARLKELKTKPVERVVENVVYQRDPALEAEIEAARREAASLLREKERIESRFRELAQEKEKKEAKLRALEEEVEKLRRWLDNARKELEKEKSRPKPPQWSKEHLEFQGLVQEASRNAASLATALGHLLEKHRARLLAAARVRGAPGDELGEMIEVVGDALLFKGFDAALKAAASKITETWEALEPGRPNLQLVKGRPES
ncbi:ParB family chromosome partitioning protein [Thermodesulfitimonas autotrophica]|uniref:ParB family chromosome partitioning protein n=1 Tax=Thermodesulfitimonas autotrophica TaxID=1894989 RepID=A0A3N5AWG3_9THEO|nr:ParB/RepB/Spo0J family partition protein [Thermodesulfitimonas autotrophica]RPF49566.1 ParB family chromosome partitioning protein [Thermodesulfitimonas autotrophica]